VLSRGTSKFLDFSRSTNISFCYLAKRNREEGRGGKRDGKIGKEKRELFTVLIQLCKPIFSGLSIYSQSKCIRFYRNKASNLLLNIQRV
jgi:hypothetical protein